MSILVVYLLESHAETIYPAWAIAKGAKNLCIVISQQSPAAVINKKVVTSTNPQIGITLHKESDETYIVCAINYSDKMQDTCLKVQEGWKLTTIYGDLEQIDKCNGAFYYAMKE